MVNLNTHTLYMFIFCLHRIEMSTCAYACVRLCAEMHFFSYFCVSIIYVVNKVSGHFFFLRKKNNYIHIYILS